MKAKKLPMVTQIVIAVLLGILCGLFFGQAASFLKILGDLFLRLMQMAIPLLIVGQIIQAVGGLPRKNSLVWVEKRSLSLGFPPYSLLHGAC